MAPYFAFKSHSFSFFTLFWLNAVSILNFKCITVAPSHTYLLETFLNSPQVLHSAFVLVWLLMFHLENSVVRWHRNEQFAAPVFRH